MKDYLVEFLHVHASVLVKIAEKGKIEVFLSEVLSISEHIFCSPSDEDTDHMKTTMEDRAVEDCAVDCEDDLTVLHSIVKEWIETQGRDLFSQSHISGRPGAMSDGMDIEGPVSSELDNLGIWPIVMYFVSACIHILKTCLLLKSRSQIVISSQSM
jgi:hypothetical protein